jgi:SAM-dependent methyltransferase
MQKWNETLLELSARQWAEAMNTTDNFCAEIRPKDAVDKHEDGAIRRFNDSLGSSTERVDKVLECIRNRGYGEPHMTVLDIGSGNGVFTLPFSAHYRSVTALDLSVAMQNEIRERAKERDIRNIEYLNADWRELDVEQSGLKDRFDLVLCSINPRGVCNGETLNKMNKVSKGGCCLSTFAGRGTSNHGAALQKIVLGRTLGTTGGNDIIFPFNAVYHMGGEPDMTYSTVRWERRQTPEAAIEGICHSYWRFADITDEVKRRIADYVFANLEDGLFVDRTEHLIGITVWDAWRIKDNGLA